MGALPAISALSGPALEWGPTSLRSWPIALANAELFLLGAAFLLTVATVVVFGVVLFRQGDRDSDGNAPSADDDRGAC